MGSSTATAFAVNLQEEQGGWAGRAGPDAMLPAGAEKALLRLRPGSSCRRPGVRSCLPGRTRQGPCKASSGPSRQLCFRWTAAGTGLPGARASSGQTQADHPHPTGGDAEGTADARCPWSRAQPRSPGVGETPSAGAPAASALRLSRGMWVPREEGSGSPSVRRAQNRAGVEAMPQGLSESWPPLIHAANHRIR